MQSEGRSCNFHQDNQKPDTLAENRFQQKENQARFKPRNFPLPNGIRTSST